MIRRQLLTGFYLFIFIQMENVFNYYLKMIKSNNSYSALAKIYVAFKTDERLTEAEIDTLELVYEFKLETLD